MFIINRRWTDLFSLNNIKSTLVGVNKKLIIFLIIKRKSSNLFGVNRSYLFRVTLKGNNLFVDWKLR